MRSTPRTAPTTTSKSHGSFHHAGAAFHRHSHHQEALSAPTPANHPHTIPFAHRTESADRCTSTRSPLLVLLFNPRHRPHELPDFHLACLSFSSRRCRPTRADARTRRRADPFKPRKGSPGRSCTPAGNKKLFIFSARLAIGDARPTQWLPRCALRLLERRLRADRPISTARVPKHSRNPRSLHPSSFGTPGSPPRLRPRPPSSHAALDHPTKRMRDSRTHANLPAPALVPHRASLPRFEEPAGWTALPKATAQW